MMRYLKRHLKVQPGYGIYLLTMVLSIIIFYVFNALRDSTMIDLLSGYSGNYVIYVELMDQLMQAISIIVVLIFVLLITYGGSIMFKRRSKEFALRLLNGQNQGHLLMMITKEQLVVDALALLIGLGIGILMSQMINVMVFYLFGENINILGFTISISALKDTLVLSMIMMVLSLVIEGIMIYRCQLDTLLHHETKSLRHRIPIGFAIIIAIISMSGLTIAYRLIFDLRFLSNDISVLLIPIGLGILSTYGLFKSIPLLVLSWSRHIQWFNQGIRFYTIKSAMVNLSHHAGIYAVVCLTLFLSLCAFGVAMGINSTYGDALDHAMQSDVMIKRYMDEDGNIIPVDTFLLDNGIDLNDFDDSVCLTVYDDVTLNYGLLSGGSYDQIIEEIPGFDMDTEVDIITMDDYNKISQFLNQDGVVLPSNSYAIAVNADTLDRMQPIANLMLQANQTLSIGSTNLYRGTDRILDHGYTTMGNGTDILLVVNMNPSSLHPYASYFVANYKYGINHDQQLVKLFETGPYTRFEARSSLLNQADMLAMVMAVVGIYLGMALSLACGALIALKTISDTLDHKNDYQAIYKIGYSQPNGLGHGLNHLLMAFGTPLVLALIHSIVGLKFVEFITNGILVSASLVVYGFTMLILLIYLIYMLFTIMIQRRIIIKTIHG